MDYIKSNSINVNDNTDPVSLFTYLLKNYSNPLSYYGNTESDALSKAYSDLVSKKFGIVEVPPSSSTNQPSYLIGRYDKNGSFKTNVITTNYRYPLNSEGRTIVVNSITNWKVGDIVINNDISLNASFAWICVEEGTPGTWAPFSHIKRWFTEIEQVTELPEATALQLGRQVVMKDSLGRTCIYYCGNTSTDSNNPVYEWIRMNIFDKDIEDKIVTLFDKEFTEYTTKTTKKVDDEIKSLDDKWSELQKNLDEALSNKVGNCLRATAEVSNDSWKITRIGPHTISDTYTLAALSSELPSIYAVVFKAPSTSIDDQTITLGKVVLKIVHYDESTLSEGEIGTVGHPVLITLDVTNQLAILPSGNSTSSGKNYMDGNTLVLGSSKNYMDGNTLVLSSTKSSMDGNTLIL